MESNNLTTTCIFLPGIPGPKKDYLILQELKKNNVRIDWLSYTGTYDRLGQGKFSVNQARKDVANIILQREAAKEPYFIIAYSFSTYILRTAGIDFSKLNFCSGILLFSTILSLDDDDIGGINFSKVIEKEKLINSDGTIKGEIPTTDKKEDEFIGWCKKLSNDNLPVFFFGGKDDYSGIDLKIINKTIEVMSVGYPHGVRFFYNLEASHKINDYIGTIAKQLVLGFVAIQLMRQALGDGFAYYVWGSVVNNIFWGNLSDIDILLIGELKVEDYKKVTEVVDNFECINNIHLGVSHNFTKDLNRTEFIRRNRGNIFINELIYSAVPIHSDIILKKPGKESLAKDSVIANKIMRAQISKDLIHYHNNPKCVAKSIIKSYMQAVRLVDYARGCPDIAKVSFSGLGKDISDLFNQAVQFKANEYRGVSFDFLYKVMIAMNEIVEYQEEIVS